MVVHFDSLSTTLGLADAGSIEGDYVIPPDALTILSSGAYDNPSVQATSSLFLADAGAF